MFMLMHTNTHVRDIKMVKNISMSVMPRSCACIISFPFSDKQIARNVPSQERVTIKDNRSMFTSPIEDLCIPTTHVDYPATQEYHILLKYGNI